jgi:hypothetical protein
MWMNVEIFCFIVIFYVAKLASPQIWKKPWPHVVDAKLVTALNFKKNQIQNGLEPKICKRYVVNSA